MPLVHVTGFPKTEKLLVCFKSYLNIAQLKSSYWVTDVADIPGSNLKELTIDIKSFDDAFKAENFLNTVPYITQNGRGYNLSAKIVDSGNVQDRQMKRNRNTEYEQPNYQNNKFRQPDNGNYEDRRSDYRNNEDRYHGDRNRKYSNERYDSHERDRSRSPIQNPSQIDLELELLRKKRLLIEEERKLLLEQQKLEMMKEFGPNACAEFETKPKIEFGEGPSTLFSANATTELQQDQQARDMLLRPQPPKKSGSPDPGFLPSPEKRALAHIPQFVLPVRIILKQMKNSIKKRATDLHDINVLKKLMTAVLRRRIAIVLENRSYTPSDVITRLYRERYPLSTDVQLIEKTLADVKACHWPKREKSKKTLERMALRKAEKEKAKANGVKLVKKGKRSWKKGGGKKTGATNAASDSKHAMFYVDVKPDKSELDVKPDINAEGVVKIEGQVKTEANTSVLADNDDWAVNGVDWDDDDSN